MSISPSNVFLKMLLLEKYLQKSQAIMWGATSMDGLAQPFLTLPMLRLLPSKAQLDAKNFEKHLNPVMLVFIG